MFLFVVVATIAIYQHKLTKETIFLQLFKITHKSIKNKHTTLLGSPLSFLKMQPSLRSTKACSAEL